MNCSQMAAGEVSALTVQVTVIPPFELVYKLLDSTIQGSISTALYLVHDACDIGSWYCYLVQILPLGTLNRLRPWTVQIRVRGRYIDLFYITSTHVSHLFALSSTRGVIALVAILREAF